jgi:acyl-CoA reductase-like NAD-dependent aldehyde dehydrogenase
MAKTVQMYIDGEWTGASSGRTFDDMNPYTGEVFATVPRAGRSDTARAIDAAADAFPKWVTTPPAEKRKLFLKAADVLESRQNDFLQALMQETGSTFGFSMFQLGFTPNLLREAASQVYNVTGEIIPSDMPGAFFMATRQPAGVVAGIAPWNAALILSLRAIALPIAYGNTAVLKPSEESPVAGGVMLAEVFHEAGFPPGVLNVITHSREEAAGIGDELIENPHVTRISFTGSTEVGRVIAEKAGRNLKRSVLELGGKDPLIILNDADLDLAVNAATFGSFLHQGQICMSTERIIVESAIAAEFTDRLAAKAATLKVGDPQEMDTIIGPLINQGAVDKVHAHIHEAAGAGATVLTGGRFEKLLYQPTVITGITPEMRIYTDQTFGPVASVSVVENAQEALRVANDSRYGLSSGIITRDFNKALEIAEQLKTGMVHINDQTVGDEPQVPFGGVRGSGWGRLGGKAALEEFTELRWISVQREPRHYPF